MNLYTRIGSGNSTHEAAALAVRLSAWHDAMVAHERRLRRGTGTGCGDECPHAEARGLWAEAVATFGARASELVFLRSRALAATRRQKGGGAAWEPLSEAADAGSVAHERVPRGDRASAGSTDAARASAEA
jgi:hypothetical protein